MANPPTPSASLGCAMSIVATGIDQPACDTIAAPRGVATVDCTAPILTRTVSTVQGRTIACSAGSNVGAAACRVKPTACLYRRQLAVPNAVTAEPTGFSMRSSVSGMSSSVSATSRAVALPANGGTAGVASDSLMPHCPPAGMVSRLFCTLTPGVTVNCPPRTCSPQ